MAESTGIILAAGAISLLNEAVFAPVAGGKNVTSQFNWRIVPATAGLAVAMAGLEKIAPKYAVGLSWLVLASALIYQSGSASSPIQNLLKIMGYAK